ncbi:small ubiquitin-related modifier 2-like [Sorex araneus]|uniref:small ubiquitin-related modifier 2-like n=1 Tax=Sorex araneus TaxID=42254 RepID=UPI00064AC376|nr:small ubiquitin-related modifier 2-like [Sorex araneus]
MGKALKNENSLSYILLSLDSPVLTSASLRESDKKPKEGIKTENNDHVNLKMAGQDGSVVQLKSKRHTPLSKLMKAHGEQQGLHTTMLEMEDVDTIDVFQQQTGRIYLKREPATLL